MNMFVSNENIQLIVDILKMTLPDKDRYNSCLVILKHMCYGGFMEGISPADIIIESLVHIPLMNEIANKLNTLKKTGKIITKDNASPSKKVSHGSSNIANEVTIQMQAYQTLQV